MHALHVIPVEDESPSPASPVPPALEAFAAPECDGSNTGEQALASIPEFERSSDVRAIDCWRAPATCYATVMHIRPARVDEAAQLTMIEDAASRIYASAGIPPDLDGLEAEVVEEAIADQLAWVATDVDDRAIGFALAWLRPGTLHLRELDVLPSHMRRGIGRSLVEFVCTQARLRGLASVTLTTFRDVAWNAPLYRRWDFVVVEPEDCPGWLTAIRAHEELGDLRHWARVAMMRRLP